jgi:hypothetical protein
MQQLWRDLEPTIRINAAKPRSDKEMRSVEAVGVGEPQDVRQGMYVNLRGSCAPRLPFLAIYRAVILEVKSNVLAFLISRAEGGMY